LRERDIETGKEREIYRWMDREGEREERLREKECETERLRENKSRRILQYSVGRYIESQQSRFQYFGKYDFWISSEDFLYTLRGQILKLSSCEVQNSCFHLCSLIRLRRIRLTTAIFLVNLLFSIHDK
jgi:hypothetical protein